MNEADGNWSAVESTDFGGGNRKITVKGIVRISAQNQKASLVEAESPSINERILLLDVRIESSGIGTQVPGTAPVHFEKPIDEDQYETVTVRDRGEEVDIPVEKRIS